MDQENQESLGAFLKQKREEKNISVEQVAYATRISLKMLRALEEDDHTALPASTFVRGYLQAYAKYLRIDTQDLLLRYQHHLATAPDAKKTPIRSHYLYVRERYQEKRRLVLIIVLFAAMLSVAGTYFMLKAKREHNKRLNQTAEQIQQGQPHTASTATTTATATAVDKVDHPDVKEILAANKSADKTADKEKTEKKDEKTDKPAATATATVTSTATAAHEPPKEKPKAVETKPEPPKVVENKAPEAKPAEKPATPAATPEVKSKKTYNLLLATDIDVWFRFQTDDEDIHSLTLLAGKTIMLRANKVIKIFSGNLKALRGTLNHKPLPTLMTSEKSKSVVLPESEAPNYPLPLFPSTIPAATPAAPTTQHKLDAPPPRENAVTPGADLPAN